MGKKDTDEGINFDDFVIGGNDFTDTLGITGDEKDKDEDVDTDGDDGDDKDDKDDISDKSTDDGEGSDDDKDVDEDEDSDEDEDEDEDSDDDSDDKDQDEDEDEDAEEEQGFTSLIEAIHEHNEWDFDPENFKEADSMEGLMDFVSEVITANSEPEYASEETAKFDEFVKRYGPEKAADYLKVNFGETDYSAIDLEADNDPEVLKGLMRDYLKETTKFSEKKIEKEITKADELGELEEDAPEYKEFMEKAAEDKKKAFDEAAEKAREDEYNKYKDYLAKQKERIDSKSEIAGFEISKKEKEALYKFAYEVSTDGKTEYQRLKEKNPDLDLELLMLAKKGVNKSKLQKQADSDAVKKVKKNMSKFTDKSSKSKSGTKTPKKSSKKGETNYNDFVLK